MKKIFKLITLALTIFCVNKGFSQDTLHLDFGNTQVVPDKAIEDKIVAWGKTLGGKKQDINIVAYYHKGEFKKFAEQRVEEMFLSVNRKVRDLVNIKKQEAKKGENSQRTRVDIIYWPEGSDGKSSKKNSDVAKKDDKKSDTKTNSNNAKTDKKTDNKKTDDKKTADTKVDDKEETATDGPVNPYGTGKDAGKKKGDEGKVIKYDPAKEYLDSTYVNGVLKVTKKKKQK